MAERAKTTTLCEETKHKAEWTHKAVTGKVCASDAAGARGAVNDDAIKNAIKEQAHREAALDCRTAGACPEGTCYEPPARVTDIRRRGQPYGFTDTSQQGDCPKGETVWNFGIRVDAKVEVQCDCPKPA